MQKLSIKESYRFENESEVKEFIESEKSKAFDDGYTLKSYSSTYKEKKAKGEVIDAGYCVVTEKIYSDFWDGGAF